MLVGIGVDLMDVGRMEDQLRAGDEQFLAGVFTPGEISYCRARHYPAQHFAARFAAKEALFKAMGLDADQGYSWRDVEVGHDPSGRPRVSLHGEILGAAARRQVKNIHLSLSHTRGMAIAQVVLES